MILTFDLDFHHSQMMELLISQYNWQALSKVNKENAQSHKKMVARTEKSISKKQCFKLQVLKVNMDFKQIIIKIDNNKLNTYKKINNFKII